MMDKVTIIIPTYDRAEFLKRTVETIIDGDYKAIHIFIIIDGNKEYCMDFIDSSNPLVTIFRNEKRMDWICSMNRGLSEIGDADAVIYASDDLEFPSYIISEAARALKKHFPDGDGLVGLSQGGGTPQASFGLMGRKFIERFPNNQAFCPNYIHYGSDWELREFALSIDKFYFCKDAILKHSKLMDKTMKLGLKVFDRDQSIKRKRVKRGFLWGKTFDMVGR